MATLEETNRPRLTGALLALYLHVPFFMALLVAEKAAGELETITLVVGGLFGFTILVACVSLLMFWQDLSRNEQIEASERKKWRWLMLLLPQALGIYWWRYCRS